MTLPPSFLRRCPRLRCGLLCRRSSSYLLLDEKLQKKDSNLIDHSGGFDSNRPGLWPPLHKADNPSLHNPLRRQERMGCDWWGAISEWEGILIEDNPDFEKQAWVALSQEEGEIPSSCFHPQENSRHEESTGDFRSALLVQGPCTVKKNG